MYFLVIFASLIYFLISFYYLNSHFYAISNAHNIRISSQSLKYSGSIILEYIFISWLAINVTMHDASIEYIFISLMSLVVGMLLTIERKLSFSSILFIQFTSVLCGSCIFMHYNQVNTFFNIYIDFILIAFSWMLFINGQQSMSKSTIMPSINSLIISCTLIMLSIQSSFYSIALYSSSMIAISLYIMYMHFSSSATIMDTSGYYAIGYCNGYLLLKIFYQQNDNYISILSLSSFCIISGIASIFNAYYAKFKRKHYAINHDYIDIPIIALFIASMLVASPIFCHENCNAFKRILQSMSPILFYCAIYKLPFFNNITKGKS